MEKKSRFLVTIRYKNTFICGLYLLSHHDHVYLLLFTPVLKAVNKDENVENENLVSVEEVITHAVLIDLNRMLINTS